MKNREEREEVIKKSQVEMEVRRASPLLLRNYYACNYWVILSDNCVRTWKTVAP